ncbi:spore gernimation protein [Paenibacillus protaetiae]|uniref:Spore gernimation protein n=2 Tax=Paenibacillus protaetiae TaxID=2509456 RepID=A0A4P6F2J6_9BACL|nr:spore gernimation protein [Paenibacillus protaetiae]
MTSKLNALHTFALLFAFLLGTSIIFGTPKVVYDTWMVDLTALLPSVLLFLLFAGMISLGKNKSLYALFIRAWGNWVGSLLIACYVTYFIYIATRNVRDMLELVLTSLLHDTPTHVLAAVFVLLSVYAAAGGVRVIGRLAVMVACMVMLFFFALGIMLYFSRSIDIERIFPVLSQGMGPVVKSAFTNSIWYPYGEMIVFLALFPKIGDAKQFRKIGLIALLSTAAVLTFSDLLQIYALGIENQRFSVFALLDAARLINLFDFITRMDALVALMIIFGVLIKCSVFIYAGARGASFLFHRRSQNFQLPLALLIGASSILVTKNTAEHVEEGLKYVIYWLHIPLQLVIPSITILVYKIRYRKGRATT